VIYATYATELQVTHTPGADDRHGHDSFRFAAFTLVMGDGAGTGRSGVVLYDPYGQPLGSTTRAIGTAAAAARSHWRRRPHRCCGKAERRRCHSETRVPLPDSGDGQ